MIAYLTSRVAIYAVIAAAAVGVYTYWHVSVRVAGYNSCIADIKEKDDVAISQAIEARNRGPVACRARGMQWNTASGQCDEG